MKIFPHTFVLYFGCSVLFTAPFMAQGQEHAAPMVGVAATQPSKGGSSIHPDAFLRNMHHQEFLDARNCEMNYLRTSILENAVKICSENKELNVKPCANNQRALDSALAKAATMACSGDPKVLASNFDTSVDVASKEGDPEAQLCYIDGAFVGSSNVNLDEYKKRATRYLQRAIKRGDWRGVALLTTDSQTIAHGGAGLMPSMNIIGKPFTIYRGYRLLELGSTGGLKKFYAGQARIYSSQLTPAQKVNANVWVAQTHMHYFTHSPLLSSPPSVCAAY